MQKSPEAKFFGFASASHPRQVEILRYNLPPSSQAPHPSISLVTLAWAVSGNLHFQLLPAPFMATYGRYPGKTQNFCSSLLNAEISISDL